jgi:hypothetical protein
MTEHERCERRSWRVIAETRTCNCPMLSLKVMYIDLTNGRVTNDREVILSAVQSVSNKI